MTALTFAATLDRILNGLTRPFFGWVSDKIGRENTMFIAFGLEGIGIFMLYKLGTDPVWFVILSGLVFFAWGEIYSLFPSTCTDTFGAKFATTNAGLLYTAKGTAALARSVLEFDPEGDGQLGHRVHHCGRGQHCRGGAGDRSTEALAAQGGGSQPVVQLTTGQRRRRGVARSFTKPRTASMCRYRRVRARRRCRAALPQACLTANPLNRQERTLP